MSAADAITPRLFLIRHGETEWSKNGRYTGITEKELLSEGEAKVKATAKTVYGDGKLVDPTKLGKVFVSPRKRAQRTWEIFDRTSPGIRGHRLSKLQTGSQNGATVITRDSSHSKSRN